MEALHETTSNRVRADIQIRLPQANLTMRAGDAILKETQEADMAIGWTGDGAVHDQIRDSIEDEIKRARSCLPSGESPERCEECGDPIPEARRRALRACACASPARRNGTRSRMPSVYTTAKPTKTASFASLSSDGTTADCPGRFRRVSLKPAYRYFRGGIPVPLHCRNGPVAFPTGASWHISCLYIQRGRTIRFCANFLGVFIVIKNCYLGKT